MSNSGRKSSEDKEYWNEIYKKNVVPEFPSEFAKFVRENVSIDGEKKKIIDLGCGNGRDSAFFKKEGLTVFSTDISYEGINKIKEIVDQVCVGDFTKWENISEVIEDEGKKYYIIKGKNGGETMMKFLLLENKFVDVDYFYIRWVWHAINKKGETDFVEFLHKRMKPGSKIFIEARTRKDPLYKKGEMVEENAYIHNNHFRRFLDTKEISEMLESKGLKIDFLEESFNFSPLGNTNPHLFRMIATKK